MKKIALLLFSLILAATATRAQSESLILSGIYQGKDLYVKNPFAKDGVGFCVIEVFVNDQLTRDEVNSSAFAIDFNILGIKEGESVNIRINHKKGCQPLVLNPESIMPHSTFKVTQINVKDNILTWTAEAERGSLPYIVEQFRWNKWVKAGEVIGKGTEGPNTYKFELTPYSGENKVRVKQVDYTKKPRYSEAVVYTPNIKPVTFTPAKPESEIVFSSQTHYEIFDSYGNLVKTGFGKKVDVADLKKGQEYYLNFDSSFGDTFKKK